MRIPLWIDDQLRTRGITDRRVLEAFAAVRREDFVPEPLRNLAESDMPLPIGCGQTISQPYIVGLSLQALELKGHERVLDIGTGSGYQAALLSHMAAEVYTVEIVPELYEQSQIALRDHGPGAVFQRLANGSLGWPEKAPFDAIVVGARSANLPKSLLSQLAIGGRMVIPIGQADHQSLFKYTKISEKEFSREFLGGVLFVPLIGEEDGP